MTAQRITNDHKEALFVVVEVLDVPVVADGPDLFVLGPYAVDGAYAVGAREGDGWAVRSHVAPDDGRMKLILALLRLERSLNAGVDKDGPYPEDW